jgi:hypothetical protein
VAQVFVDAGHRQQILGVGRRPERVAEQPTETAGERDQAQDVVEVVGEDLRHRPGIAVPDILKVELGDHPGRHVTAAGVAEDRALDGPEGARVEAIPPEAAGREEQVEVRVGAQGPALAAGGEARLEERQVERLAIEADDGPEAGEQLAEREQHRRLLGVVAHEVLAEDESVALEIAEADQEDVGAGPAGEPGRLGVEEHDLASVERRQAGGAGQAGEGAVRQHQEPVQRLPAVDVAEAVRPLADEAGSGLVLPDGTRHERLDADGRPWTREEGRRGFRRPSSLVPRPTGGWPERPTQPLAQVDAQRPASEAVSARLWGLRHYVGTVPPGSAGIPRRLSSHAASADLQVLRALP